MVCALAALAVISLPLWCAAVAIRSGWTPVGDWAEVATRAADSFTRARPMLGMPSTLSSVTEANAHHPGPLMFWAFALPTRVFAHSGVGSIIGAALVSSASIIVTLWAAARRIERGGVLIASVLLALFMYALGGSFIVSAVNPFTAVLPLVAFSVLVWGILDGDRILWPPAMVFGSYAAQAHITFLPVVGALLVVLVVDLVVGLLRRPRDGDSEHSRGDAPSRRLRAMRLPAVTVAAGLACWSGPIYDQLFGTGNLWALASQGPSTDRTFGWRYAAARTLDVFGVPPRWLATELPRHAPTLSTARALGALVVIAVGIAGAVAASRRGDRKVARLGVVAAAGLVGCTVATALVPVTIWAKSTSLNRFIYLPTGLVAWAFILSAAVALVPRSWIGRLDAPAPGLRLGAGALGLVVVVASIWPVWSNADPQRRATALSHESARVFAEVIEARREASGATEPVWVAAGGFRDQAISWGVIALLTLRGHEVHVNERSLNAFGPARRCTGTESARYYVVDRGREVPPRATLLATFNGADHQPQLAGPPVSLYLLAQPCTELKRY